MERVNGQPSALRSSLWLLPSANSLLNKAKGIILGMPMTIKQDDLREHVTRIRILDDKEAAPASSGKSILYKPTKEEMEQIAHLIEKISGMKVDDRVKTFRVEFVTAKQAKEIRDNSLLSEVTNPREAVLFEGEVRRNKGDMRHAPGFVFKKEGTVYLISDSFEESGRKKAVRSIRNGAIEGKLSGIIRKRADENAVRTVEKVMSFYVVAHELTHEVLEKNAPVYASANSIAEVYRAIDEIVKIKGMHEREKLIRETSKKLDRLWALHGYQEAVAYSVAYKVVREMGYSPEIMHSLSSIAGESEVMKGMKFLAEIDRITGKNPFELTFHNPPEKMSELENPVEYLNRIGYRAGQS